MSRVLFIGDLHLSHEGALKWASKYREGNNVDEMNLWLIDQWNSVVKDRDLVWVLGDVAWGSDALQLIHAMNGRKKLCLGNHDTMPLKCYERVFEEVVAYRKYKGFWLSHMPVHSYDMDNCRVKGSIHGHLHQNIIEDPRYHNVSVEQCNGVPILFEDILAKHHELNGGDKNDYKIRRAHRA